MKTIHILNPAAGQGKALKYSELENAYVTKCPGDACDFVKSALEKTDEETNFKVYGGDGTVNEVVSGIVGSGKQNGYMSIMPVGTGNDLVRSLDKSKDNVKIDVLTVGKRYAVNAINTGFDLEVVLKAAELKKKPLISGSLAYVLGIFSALFGKYGKHLHVEYTDAEGKVESFDGDCLLVVAANGAFYGGGFNASPIAELEDGLIDLMIVRKVSRLKFMSLVLKYQKGLHIDKQTRMAAKGFEDILIFKKCTNVLIEGTEKMCADGEIFEAKSANIGIIPQALKVITKEKETVNA